ncbi:septum formation protein Maf [Leptospira perolatii]|uniref:dTTP/UTP pyrophosphatase n=1 Tax=Leptospira perolatii TaxID=2023191 RepID=A0A2M9ZR87_9LEPT|nr:nucleoside triphosphate pyrophosphatase [Leptospira perolatii]PJZ71065.1 septum formation protein Maf [Leptospira perolatii]PJZ74597.1 septum formation protein Maf [Leptospira perolatii]
MLLLRSKSPRRKEIFDTLNLVYEIDPFEVDESSFAGERPLDYLKRITLAKLGPAPLNSSDLYVSADTIVVFENSILQKPTDIQDAIEMLRMLNGKSHFVYSGLGLSSHEKTIFDYDTSEVEFKKLEKEKIQKYVKEALPLDKAGAYGIQDFGSPVKNFKGSYTNIVGFPIRKFYSEHDLWSPFLRGNITISEWNTFQ